MCGIAGFTGTSDKKRAERMAQILEHRGKDDAGFFGSAEVGVTLVFRRLSILDTSAAGHQPMTSRDGNVTIVFNGEIYNSPELRKELEALGTKFRGHSDTEVILKGYSRWGSEMLQKLRGMWGLCLYDKKKDSIILSRDPFGIKPLVYAIHDDGELSFASELKALRPQLGAKPQLDPEAQYLYFILGYIPAPLSIWKNVRKLLPGEVLTFDLAKKTLTRDRIWFPTDAEGSLEPEQAMERLNAALSGSVRAHFLSDVPVGIFLSGGKDSSLLAILAKEQGFRPEAFHMAIPGSEDTVWARSIAKKLNLPYHEFAFQEKDIAELYQDVWKILDEPFADPSIFPTLLISRHAAERVKVILSGEGGDELFGGYYQHRALLGLGRGSEESALLRILDSLPKIQTAWGQTYSTPMLRRLGLLGAKLAKDGLAAYLLLLEQAALSADLSPAYQVLARLITGKRHSPSPFVFDERIFLPNDLLYKIDMASMRYTLEGRVPILDREVLKAAAMLSPRSRIGKTPIDHMLVRRDFEDLVGRKKSGFSFPVEKMLFGPFQKDVESALQRAGGMAAELPFHKGFLEKLARERGFRAVITRKYPRTIYAILAWHKFMDSN